MPRLKPAKLLNLPCSFKNVNFGDKSVRLGVTVERSELGRTASAQLASADRHFCETRLTARIIAKPQDSLPDQESLPGMEDDLQVEAVADVKSFGVHAKHVDFGLTFAIKGIPREALTHFAKRHGRLLIDALEEIPEGDEDDLEPAAAENNGEADDA